MITIEQNLDARNSMTPIHPVFSTTAMKNEIPEQLKTGIRVLKVLHRVKDGGPQKEHRRVIDYAVSTSPEDWDKKVERLMKHVGEGNRLYASVNERNIIGAAKDFQQTLTDAIFAGPEQLEFFMTHTGTKGLSALMQNKNARNKMFMFDIDTKDVDIQANVLKLLIPHTEMIASIETKNGFHWITKPFNPNLFKNEYPVVVSLQKDSLFLVAY